MCVRTIYITLIDCRKVVVLCCTLYHEGKMCIVVLGHLINIKVYKVQTCQRYVCIVQKYGSFTPVWDIFMNNTPP